MADRIVEIEVVYTPARGKAGEARDVLEEALDSAFMRLTDGLITAGHTTFRVLEEVDR